MEARQVELHELQGARNFFLVLVCPAQPQPEIGGDHFPVILAQHRAQLALFIRRRLQEIFEQHQHRGGFDVYIEVVCHRDFLHLVVVFPQARIHDFIHAKEQEHKDEDKPGAGQNDLQNGSIVIIENADIQIFEGSVQRRAALLPLAVKLLPCGQHRYALPRGNVRAHHIRKYRLVEDVQERNGEIIRMEYVKDALPAVDDRLRPEGLVQLRFDRRAHLRIQRVFEEKIVLFVHAV